MVDSHTHILDDSLIDRADDIVRNMKADGLDFIVEISADPQESKACVEFASKHKDVYCTIGVHPIFSDQYNDEFETWARTIKSDKIKAFGECGLDYYHEGTRAPSREVQLPVFIRQIKLANELGLPLVIHSRDACVETYNILKEHQQYLNNGVLLHCFSYSAKEEEMYKSLDCYFAFGGSITFRNCDIATEAVRNTPLDRLLVETDAPYLAPVPVRRNINEPKYVRYIIEHIAKILNMTFDEVEKITTENAKRFFRV